MNGKLTYSGWSLNYFKYFNCSILDWHPDHINHHLANEQAALAKRIIKQLKGRSRNEIERLIQVVDKVFQSSQNLGDGLEALINEYEIREFMGPPSEATYAEINLRAKMEEFVGEYGLNVSALLLLSQQYDLSSVKDHLDITWCEFFAICAYCKLGEVLAEIDSKAGYAESDAPHHYVEYKILISASYYLFQAYDLAAISERFNDKDEFFIQVRNDQFKRKISLKNQVNVEKRHAPANDIKCNFIGFFKAKRGINPKVSRSAAATEFYLSLSPAEKRTIAPSGMESNAVRTLTRALREHEKA